MSLDELKNKTRFVEKKLDNGKGYSNFADETVDSRNGYTDLSNVTLNNGDPQLWKYDRNSKIHL